MFRAHSSRQAREYTCSPACSRSASDRSLLILGIPARHQRRVAPGTRSRRSSVAGSVGAWRSAPLSKFFKGLRVSLPRPPPGASVSWAAPPRDIKRRLLQNESTGTQILKQAHKPSCSWVSEQSRASTFRRVTQLCSPRRRGFDMPASRHSGPHLAKAPTEVSAEEKLEPSPRPPPGSCCSEVQGILHAFCRTACNPTISTSATTYESDIQRPRAVDLSDICI